MRNEKKSERVDFEHTYSHPCHKKYFNGLNNPAEYLFTVPSPNIVTDTSSADEYVDVKMLDHDPPLCLSSEKLNNQLDKSERAEYDAYWMEKVNKKEWKHY